MKARFMFRKSALLAVSLALIFVTVAFAASGDLDATFSGDGRIVQGFGGTAHYGFSLAVQPDGKLVVAGGKRTALGLDFAIARYNPDGTLDTTFNTIGKKIVNIGIMDTALGVAIQTDGKIVVGGRTCNIDFSICDVAVARLNPNGSLDTTFSGDGKLRTNFGPGDNGSFDLTLQGTKIVLAGYMYTGTSYDAAVYRYLSNGNLDTTFSGDGIATVNFGATDGFNAVAVYSGKIYLTGTRWATGDNDMITARLNGNGTLDTTFSGDGKVRSNLSTDDSAWDLAVTGGKLIVAGRVASSLAILKFTSSGALDTSFSGDGILLDPVDYLGPDVRGLTLQSGNIVIAGSIWSGDALLVRLTAEGNRDITFGTNGIITTDWNGGADTYRAVIFKNSRLYVVGTTTTPSDVSRFIIAAYLP
jgi:uncharacterized delta-60 repeat protein